MKALPAGICLSLAACVAAPEVAEENADPDLVGEWRIAGIDGNALDMPVGLALSIDADIIEYPSGCGGHAWRYRVEGHTMSTTPTRTPDMDCLARSTFPREVFTAAAAIDAAERIERTPENGMRLFGGGRSLTIFSQ